jgi:hypothetical protein
VSCDFIGAQRFDHRFLCDHEQISIRFTVSITFDSAFAPLINGHDLIRRISVVSASTREQSPRIVIAVISMYTARLVIVTVTI